MKLTVGKIEELLRKYPKGTEAHVGCNCCNHSAAGHESILGIEDKTAQTYGYIEIKLNSKTKGRVELNPDKEEFYIKEIEKLNKEIDKLKKKVEIYEEFKNDMFDTVERKCDYIEDRIEWMEDK